MSKDSVGSVSLDLVLNSSAFEKTVNNIVKSTINSMKSTADITQSTITSMSDKVSQSVSKSVDVAQKKVQEYQKKLDEVSEKQEKIIWDTINSYKSIKLPHTDALIDKDITDNKEFQKLEQQWNSLNSKLDMYKQKLMSVKMEEQTKSAVSQMNMQLEANRILSMIQSQDEYNDVLKYTKDRMKDIENVAKNTSKATGVDVNSLLQANGEYQKLSEQLKVLTDNQDRFKNSTSNVTVKLQEMFDKGVSGLERMKDSNNELVSSIGGKLLPEIQKIAPMFTKIAGVVGTVAGGVTIVIGLITTGVKVLEKVDDVSNKVLNRVQQGLDEITGGLKKTIDLVKKLTGKSNDFENKWSTALRNIGYLMVSVFGVRQLYNFLQTSVEVASQTQSAWVGLNSIIKGQGKSFTDAKKFIEDYTSDGLVPLNNAVTAYKNLISAGYEEKQAQEMMIRLKDAAAFGRQAHLTLGNAVTTATEGIKNENSVLVDNAGVTKNLSVMWEEYAKSIGKGAKSLTAAEKRIATYNGLMKETQFQVGDAQKATETFSGKVARLSATFSTLKTAIGNVVIPILELFIPALQKAMETMTRFFNMVADIMAQFGLKMKTAEELSGSAINGVGASALETAENIAGTGDAAKDAAKKINSAFNSVDEINVLDTSSNATDSSDSKLDEADLSNLKGEVEETESLLDQLKKTAFEYGAIFADKINGALSKINWDKIKNASKTIAYNIADFLNGFVAELDWTLLGRTIGEGINTALIFANTYLTTFDWKEWGKGLANGINGIVYSIDWKLLGETIANYFNMSIDTALGFVKNLDWVGAGLSLAEALNSMIESIHWNNIAETFITGFKGIIDGLEAFILKTDWNKIGDSIVDTLNKAIENIDWKRTGKVLGNAIKKILGLISKILKETNWKQVINDFFEGVDFASIIVEYVKIKMELSKMKWTVVWEVIKEILIAGFQYIGEHVWNTLSGWVDTYIIQPIKDIFNSESILELGENLINGIFKGIKGILVAAPTILKALIFDPIVGAVKFLFGIHSPSTVFAEMGEFMIEGLWKGISDKKTWMINKWKEVKTWFTDITAKASVKITTTKTWLQQKHKDLTSVWKDKTAKMKATVATKWSDLRTKWNNLMKNFKDKTITVKAKIGEVVGNLKSTINSKIIKPINNKLPKMFPKIPLLAQGGWFDTNNPQLAIVGDNKREPEIVAPESKIEDAVVRALDKRGNTSTSNKLELEILVKYEDGRRIIKKINDYQIQQGKVLLMT